MNNNRIERMNRIYRTKSVVQCVRSQFIDTIRPLCIFDATIENVQGPGSCDVGPLARCLSRENTDGTCLGKTFQRAYNMLQSRHYYDIGGDTLIITGVWVHTEMHASTVAVFLRF